MTSFLCIYSLTSDKSVAWHNLKAFAEDTLNVCQVIEFVFVMEENIVGKGENAGYQHFLLFQESFQSLHFHGCLYKGLCGKG